MQLGIEAWQALVFLPFVLPVCFYICWSDLAHLKIFNAGTDALMLIFVVVGFFLFPFDEYMWRVGRLVVFYLLGMLFHAAGVLPGGDARVIAATAPFIETVDLFFFLMLFATTALAAVGGHYILSKTPLRQKVPHWKSWQKTFSFRGKFPFGLPAAFSLGTYLILGATYGL